MTRRQLLNALDPQDGLPFLYTALRKANQRSAMLAVRAQILEFVRQLRRTPV